MKGPILCVMRGSGDDPSLLIERFLEIMTLAAFEIEVRVLMLGGMAVYAQVGTGSEAVNGMIEALPLYGVDHLYVEEESLKSLALEGVLRPQFKVTERAGVMALLRDCPRLMGS